MRSRVLAAGAAAVALLVSLLLLAPAVSHESARQGRFVIGASDDTTTPFNLVSIPALVRHRYDGRGFARYDLVRRNRVARKWRIRYVADGRPLTGTLLVPRTPGRHPVVVSLHGWAAAPDYTIGRGLVREEWSLAERGFVVLHPDYRNFGDSWTHGPTPSKPAARPLGYPADVLNAVLALKRADLGGVETSRIGLFGRSMGGGVAVQVAEARPSWFRALVLYSPVSAEAADDYDRWVRPDASLRHRVTRAYGTPSRDPAFWYQASAANYLGRLRMPVQVHHGTADPVCPIAWSRLTVSQMRAAGVRVSFAAYRGERHRFDRAWPVFISRVDRFFLRTLR